jgi:hypothetical protein
MVFIALYLFPSYIGQEVFIDFLSERSGGDYWSGVYLAAVIAGLIGLAGLFLIRPQYLFMLKNPYAVGAFAALLVIAYVSLQGVL